MTYRKIYRYTINGEDYGLGHIMSLLQTKRIEPGTEIVRSDGKRMIVVNSWGRYNMKSEDSKVEV